MEGKLYSSIGAQVQSFGELARYETLWLQLENGWYQVSFSQADPEQRGFLEVFRIVDCCGKQEPKFYYGGSCKNCEAGLGWNEGCVALTSNPDASFTWHTDDFLEAFSKYFDQDAMTNIVLASDFLEFLKEFFGELAGHVAPLDLTRVR